MVQEGAVTQPDANLEVCDDDKVKEVYNSTKGRWERWVRGSGGDNVWILFDAQPARVWRERFMGHPVSISHGPGAGLIGILMELPWNVNGRVNGGNLPDSANFAATNEIGGGLNMKAIAGGQDNDYVAIHWGDNYPTKCSKSPHCKATLSPVQTTFVAHMCGLVDVSRSQGVAAYALPDNGIFVSFDTDIDGNAHAIIRSNGVNQTDQSLGAPTPGAHLGVHTVVSDDGEGVEFIVGDTVVVAEVDISGAVYDDLRAAQLQPYSVVVNRAAAQLREHHMHDFRMIMDKGF